MLTPHPTQDDRYYQTLYIINNISSANTCTYVQCSRQLATHTHTHTHTENMFVNRNGLWDMIKSLAGHTKNKMDTYIVH